LLGSHDRGGGERDLHGSATCIAAAVIHRRSDAQDQGYGAECHQGRHATMAIPKKPHHHLPTPSEFVPWVAWAEIVPIVSRLSKIKSRKSWV
jgi:hypothetical protein